MKVIICLGKGRRLGKEERWIGVLGHGMGILVDWVLMLRSRKI